MNITTLIGRLGKAPELKKSKDGKEYVYVSLAVSRKGSDGKEATDWIPCMFNGKSAETLSKYVDKGGRICVNGSLRSSSYEKDGQKITNYYVSVVSFDIIDFKEKDKKEEAPEESGMPFEF